MRRRQLYFDNFEQALAEVDRLRDVPYERMGKWGLAQVCDHLASAFDGSMKGFSFSLNWPMRNLFGSIGLHYVLWLRRVPFRARVPRNLEPPDTLPVDASVQSLRAKIREFENFQQPLAMHPFFGSITRDQWWRIH